jgi:hypothetical protein
LEFTALPFWQVRLLIYSSERPNTPAFAAEAMARQAGHPPPVLVLVNLGNASLITKASLPTKLEARLLRLCRVNVASSESAVKLFICLIKPGSAPIPEGAHGMDISLDGCP